MNKKAYYRTLITLKRELDSSSYYSLFETVNIFNKVNEDIQKLSFETFEGGLLPLLFNSSDKAL
ncbi:hypothetical protein A163_17800 [Vibrio tasmaniensis 1F-267]|uniref:Uncharacterized protein n=1 Tax=Vibrio tasmaniensis 1F-267 TaxID=1191324 RepID=A0ABX3B9D4_9VIBR|nr:hypothetical protein A163_17800 [Vibrio tasmaniensis 1F-267]